MLQCDNNIRHLSQLVAEFSHAIDGPQPRREAIMQAGQKVRFKAASPLSLRFNIPREAQGAVLCRYRLLRGENSVHRLDVQFGPQLVVWGAPDDQFETVEEETSQS